MTGGPNTCLCGADLDPECPHGDVCCDCFEDPDLNDADPPMTEEDRIDAAGDDLFHSMREDGEL